LSVVSLLGGPGPTSRPSSRVNALSRG